MKVISQRSRLASVPSDRGAGRIIDSAPQEEVPFVPAYDLLEQSSAVPDSDIIAIALALLHLTSESSTPITAWGLSARQVAITRWSTR